MGDAVSEQSSLSQDSLALPCEHLGIFRGNDMPLTTNSQRVKQNTADKSRRLDPHPWDVTRLGNSPIVITMFNVQLPQ
jgi:hypothetical protein